jgi:hypothetical protein
MTTKHDDDPRLASAPTAIAWAVAELEEALVEPDDSPARVEELFEVCGVLVVGSVASALVFFCFVADACPFFPGTSIVVVLFFL